MVKNYEKFERNFFFGLICCRFFLQVTTDQPQEDKFLSHFSLFLTV